MTSHYYKNSFHAQTPSKCPGNFQRSVDHTMLRMKNGIVVSGYLLGGS